MAKFKAMVLDERDVLRGVVELESESQLTERHVDLRPFGGDCDNKPGEYYWNREHEQLIALPRAQRALEGRPTLEQAFAFLVLKKAMLPAPKADLATSESVEIRWLDDMVLSVDFTPFRALPLVQGYMAARNLTVKKGS